MSDKIHPPTPRRRQLAKEQGRAPRSNEVVTASLLLASTALLRWFGPSIGNSLMQSLSRSMIGQPELTTSLEETLRKIALVVLTVSYTLLPVLIGVLLLAVAFNLMQTGVMITPHKLAPSFARVSPGNQLTAMFSVRSWGRLIVNLLKLIAVAAVAFYLVQTRLTDLLALSGLPVAAIATALFDLIAGCCLWIGTTLCVFAAADYAFCWWQHERDLMMTEQELRDELRDTQPARRGNATARSQSVQGVS